MSYLVPTQPLENVILSLDDFYLDPEAMALNQLFYLKHKYPGFKVTLFAIPLKTKDSYQFFKEIATIPWIELAVHGLYHDPINECELWDRDTAESALVGFEALGCFKKVFKAPSWKYSEETYQALLDYGWVCADLAENVTNHPIGLKSYLSDHPWCVHGHTWNLNNPDPSYNNGIKQIMERGVPWTEETQFHFITDIV